MFASAVLCKVIFDAADLMCSFESGEFTVPIPTCPSVSMIKSPVPAVINLRFAFDPLDVKSFAVTLVAVTTPANVPAPSTSSAVPFNNLSSSLLILTAILFEPAFFTLNSIAPSSVPSDASKIFPDIEAY